MEEQERLLQEAQSKQKNFNDGIEQTRAFLQQLLSQLDDIDGDFAASAIVGSLSIMKFSIHTYSLPFTTYF